MTSEIIELEQVFNDLLPISRLEGRPSGELLDAAVKWSEAIWKTGESLGVPSISSEQIETAFRLSRRPVFICGVHRSGTTLVRDMLDGHPALTVLPSEGSFLTNLEPRMRQMSVNEQQSFLGMEWLRRFANPINQPPYWLLGRTSIDDSPYVHFVRNFKAWQELKNKRFNRTSFKPLIDIILAYASINGEITTNRWVDKTPTNEQFLKKLWKEMPEAKIIHIVRDPVAVLLSRRRMEPTLNTRAFIRDLKTSFQVAQKWSGQNEGRYLLLRYEDLCVNPDFTAKKLSEFLEIDFLPSLLCPTVAGKASAANSSFKQKSPEGRILSAEEHNYTGLLNEEDELLLITQIGDIAQKLGYQMRSINVWRTRFLKLKYHGNVAYKLLCNRNA